MCLIRFSFKTSLVIGKLRILNYNEYIYIYRYKKKKKLTNLKNLINKVYIHNRERNVLRKKCRDAPLNEVPLF